MSSARTSRARESPWRGGRQSLSIESTRRRAVVLSVTDYPLRRVSLSTDRGVSPDVDLDDPPHHAGEIRFDDVRPWPGGA
jgi:hypothetical protein